MSGRPSLQPGSTFAGAFTVARRAVSDAGSYLVDATRGEEPVTLQVFPQLTPAGELGRKRFVDAALASRTAESDHVPEIVAAGVDDASGAAWIAIERLEGRRLDEVLGQRGHLTTAEVGEILGQAAHGLDAAHEIGIVHGALCPETIFLAKSRRAGSGVVVKLLQIGVAPLLQEVDHSAPRAQSTWAAPELSDAGQSVGRTADVWTIGLLAFRLLTGRSYWKSLNMAHTPTVELMRESLVDDIVSPSERALELDAPGDLPPGFDAWFANCVAREPDARFATAGEAIGALRPILDVREPFESSPESYLRPPGHADEPESHQLSSDPHEIGSSEPPPPIEPPAAPSELPAAPSAPPSSVRPPSSRAPIADPFHDVAPAPSKPSPAAGRARRWLVAVAVIVVLLGGTATAIILPWPELWRGKPTAAAVETDDEPDDDDDTGPRRPLALRRAVEHHQLAPVPVSADDAQWGSPVAPVTIVEFGDFRSSASNELASVLDELRNDYGSGRLRIVWKHHPMRGPQPETRAAAEAARTVLLLGGEDAFWKFHDQLLSHRDELTESRFADGAMEAGVSRDRFLRDFDWDQRSPRIDADIKLAKQVGAGRSPTAFVNGIRVDGVPSYKKLRNLVDEQLTAAQEERRDGTEAEDIYVALATKNYELPTKGKPPIFRVPARGQDSDTLWKVPVLADDPHRGAKEALVTIVEFADFQCPFCKRSRATLDELLDEYEDDLRVVWKDQPLPFHKRARSAATLAHLVYAAKGNDAFWLAHDRLFESAPTLEESDLRTVAVGLDMGWTAIRSDVEAGRHARLDTNIELARKLGVRGTPTFFINGRRLSGSQPSDRFSELIDEELVKAEVLVLSGTARAKVYEETIEAGKERADDP